MKIGLFFGSFNPIHIGHLIIANHFAEFTDLEAIWFIVSPHNPLKNESELINATDRLKMVQLATKDNPQFYTNDIELNLPIPSYTINTLSILKDKYENHEFVIIMGADSIAGIKQWKDYKKILADNEIYIYNRQGFDKVSLTAKSKLTYFNFPFLDISATYIRQCIKDGKSIQYLVPEQIFAHLQNKSI